MDEKNKQNSKAAKIVKITVASIACLVLLLSLTVVVWWSIAGVKTWDEGVTLVVKLFTPKENDVFYKDSYSVSDDKAFKNKDTVVGNVGGKPLTNGQLQIYYWTNVYDFLQNYGYEAMMDGLDYPEPFDQQKCPYNSGTWQQYFLSDALQTWHKYQALALMAEADNYQLSEEGQSAIDNLRENMEKNAKDNGFASVDEMIQYDMGGGCNFDDQKAYMETYIKGYLYFEDVYKKVDVSSAALEKYFADHEADLKKAGITKESGKTYAVRHILIGVVGTEKDSDGKTVITETDWETCRQKAQKLLDEWLAGEHTEETFAEFTVKHSEDKDAYGNVNSNGIYTDLDENTNFVQPFKDWYLDESRQVGDYGLVKTTYGYHIMYLSAKEEKWEAQCRNGILADAAKEVLKTATDTYTMEVDYKKIMLAVVELG